MLLNATTVKMPAADQMAAQPATTASRLCQRVTVRSSNQPSAMANPMHSPQSPAVIAPSRLDVLEDHSAMRVRLAPATAEPSIIHMTDSPRGADAAAGVCPTALPTAEGSGSPLSLPISQIVAAPPIAPSSAAAINN